MDEYRPSWFDRMLEQADQLLRRGFAIITGEEPYDFDRHVREQELVPVPIAQRPRPQVRRGAYRHS